jgi:hypothetical protein
MFHRTIAAFAGAAALLVMMSGAFAFDESKYPDLSGQWRRVATGAARYDPAKPAGRGQQAPLKAEYKAMHEASIADQKAGGQGLDTAYRCFPMGMPRQMSGTFPFEFVVTPQQTHILFELVIYSTRRIYTDGRDWPEDDDPTFAGYSIGKWLDTDGDGRYDTLEVETRYFKGPRNYEPSGLPLHADNQSVIKERLFLDPANKDILRNEITVFDHALTRPWMVSKNYHRTRKVEWHEDLCSESNNHVMIGKENYFLSADGFLMPAKKDQAPPDLRYFKQTRK